MRELRPLIPAPSLLTAGWGDRAGEPGLMGTVRSGLGVPSWPCCPHSCFCILQQACIWPWLGAALGSGNAEINLSCPTGQAPSEKELEE